MDETLRPKTLRPAEQTYGGTTIRSTAMPQASTEATQRPATKTNTTYDDGADEFVLKGRHYTNIRCISDNSGEAQVFLVAKDGQEYVLKVYYPNFSIKKSILRVIKSMEMEMVVKLLDFGKTYVDGKNRDYELMEYLRGGTLNEYRLNGDVNQMRRIALQAAAALAFCHNNGIIHKDIKPSNFFFRDEEHKEVVLGDFGISSMIQDDEKLHRTTQARTPVYAAPEMYSDVIDGVVEITPAVDYYSLGITLLTLWLGENPMSLNERAMMRKKNEGRIPHINELPERIKMLIQGLTAVNPQNRWTYEEVEKWFLGESPKVDISSPILRYKSFIVDPENNVVADNIHELIPLLLKHERLAIGYLYGGRLTAWLEQCGNMKLSTVVKDIVQNKYPADQHAGLMASVYAMEPTYPYEDVKGNLCDDVHSVALSLLSYVEDYSILLRNPSDNLWLYLESHSTADIERLRSYFSYYQDFNGRIAILRTVYEIDKSIPFLPKYPSSTLAEIVKAFGYSEVTDDEWESLTDGRLLSWMYSHEDNMACESLRIMTTGTKHSKQLAYKVLYNVYRDAAYDLRSAKTPKEVGEVLKKELIRWQHMDDIDAEAEITAFSDPEGRFMYYAQLHGWHEQLNQAISNFDLKSEENRERLSAYDLRTAAYRMCRILGVSPVYVLSDGTELDDGTEIDESLYPQIKPEIRKSAFAQWLSVWYHENPLQDFSEEYSYEKTLEKWILKLGEIDSQQLYYRRFINAKEETSKRFRELRDNYRKSRKKEKFWFYTFYALVALWTLLVLFVGISGRAYLLFYSFFTIALPLGGMTALIISVRSYFRGYGILMSCLWGALSMLTSFIPIWILKFAHHSHPGMFIPAVLFLTAAYTIICFFTDFKGERRNDHKLMESVLANDVKSELLEPLYYTFRTKSYRYKSSKFGLLNDVQDQLHSVTGESILHYVLWSMLALVMIAELVVYSPKLLNVSNPDLENLRMVPTKMVKQIQKDVE